MTLSMPALTGKGVRTLLVRRMQEALLWDFVQDKICSCPHVSCGS